LSVRPRPPNRVHLPTRLLHFPFSVCLPTKCFRLNLPVASSANNQPLPPRPQIRSMLKRRQQGKYASKVASREGRKQHVAANPLPHDELADVFK